MEADLIFGLVVSMLAIGFCIGHRLGKNIGYRSGWYAAKLSAHKLVRQADGGKYVHLSQLMLWAMRSPEEEAQWANAQDLSNHPHIINGEVIRNGR